MNFSFGFATLLTMSDESRITMPLEQPWFCSGIGLLLLPPSELLPPYSAMYSRVPALLVLTSWKFVVASGCVLSACTSGGICRRFQVRIAFGLRGSEKSVTCMSTRVGSITGALAGPESRRTPPKGMP